MQDKERDKGAGGADREPLKHFNVIVGRRYDLLIKIKLSVYSRNNISTIACHTATTQIRWHGKETGLVLEFSTSDTHKYTVH